MSYTHLPFDIICLAESEPPKQHFTLRTLFWESEKIGGRGEVEGGERGKKRGREIRKRGKRERKKVI